MKKFIFIFSFVIAILATLSAQEYVINGGGTPIGDYYPGSSSQLIVGEDGNSIVMYHNSINANKLFNQNRLVTYNLNNRDVRFEELTLPPGEQLVFATFDHDANVMAYYMNVSKAKQLIFSHATIARSSKAQASKEIKPEVLLNYVLEPKDKVRYFAAESPDKKSFGIVLVVLNQHNKLKNYIVHVFNKNGEILWNQTFDPNFKNNHFLVHDFALTNKHKALFLISSATSTKNKLTNPAMHIVSLYKMDQVNMENTTPFGFITSMKMLILQNGKYFVSGYYEEKPNTFAIGNFSAVYDVRLEEQKTIQTTEYTISFKDRTDVNYDEFTFSNQNYQLACKQLFELPSGFVAMVGEQYRAVPFVDPKEGVTTYTNYTKAILYNMYAIDSDGERAGTDVIKRAQWREGDFPVTYNNDAIRYFSPIYNKATGLITSVHTVPAASEGLSFASFAQGDAVYLLYNDNFINYDNPEPFWSSINLNKPNQTCLVLTRLNKPGNSDKKVLMVPGKEVNLYNQMWHFDGHNIIFGYTNKKEGYLLQHFKLSDQWNWDY